jgi:hypothetical protein
MDLSNNSLKTNPFITTIDPRTLDSSFEQLRTMALQWSTQHLDGLYQLLEECYKIYYNICMAEDSQQTLLEQEVDSLFGTLIVNDPGASKTLHTKIIRLVFETSQPDRKQVSRYASVLRAAFETDTRRTQYVDPMYRVAPLHFRSWINALGITQATKSAVPGKPLVYDVDAALSDLVLMKELAEVKNQAVGSQIHKGQEEFKLAVCRWDDAAKTLMVYKIIEDQEKVRSAFKPYVKEVGIKVEELVKQQMSELKTRMKSDLTQKVVEEAR